MSYKKKTVCVTRNDQNVKRIRFTTTNFIFSIKLFVLVRNNL